MGDTQEQSNVETLLKVKGYVYGDAWKEAGEFIRQFELGPMIKSGYFFAWIIIICKAIRALVTPYHPDHWKDIAGYATLVVKDLEARNAQSQ